MRVVELWRYPVKSLQGERIDSVAINRNGLEGDRQFAIYDLATGFGLTGREDVPVAVEFPDGGPGVIVRSLRR